MLNNETLTYVVFEDRTKPNIHWFQYPMQSGFRHCYLIHWDGYSWFRVENTYGYLHFKELVLLEDYVVQGVDISNWFRSKGHTLVKVDLAKRSDSIRTPWLFTPNTCVELVKNFLGIGSWSIITPYQLFKYLRKEY